MTESDLLARAARGLREAHTGEREGSGFTRARIMNTLHRERRQRTLRWAVLSPLASLLLVGSAWAQSTGKWPVIWSAVASVFVAAPAEKPAPAPSPQAQVPRPGRDARAASGSARGVDAGDEAGDEEAPALPSVQPAPGQGGAAVTSPAERAERARKPARQRRARPDPAPSPGPSSTEPQPTPPAGEAPAQREPGRDRELSRFRRAHDLHFEGRARDAADAYADYLREYPSGRFVPEARYAMALDQIKLGDHAAAREALTPFAAGQHAGYRQAEARKLLQALEKKVNAGAR